MQWFKLRNWQKQVAVFVLLLIIVSFLQFILLRQALEVGFRTDDWLLRFDYKLLGDNSLSKISDIWVRRGAHTAYQFYYPEFLKSY